jgi:hypothetical protein
MLLPFLEIASRILSLFFFFGVWLELLALLDPEF